MAKLIYPFGVFRVFLNLKCNMTCGYCSMQCQRDLWKGDEFKESTPDQWIRAFERLEPTRKKMVITFCNAEPAIYKGCSDIINSKALENRFSQIYTNMSTESMIEIRKMKPRDNLDFYVSYHHGQIELDEFIANAKELKAKHRIIDFHPPMYPPIVDKIKEDAKVMAKHGIFLNTDHGFFGLHKGEMHWQYLGGGDWIKRRFANRLEGKPKRKVLCKTSTDHHQFFSRGYTAAPDGDLYECWRYLYNKDERGRLGSFFDEDFQFKDEYFECDEYGDCNFCAWHKNIKDAETGEQLDMDSPMDIGTTISACMIVRDEEELLPQCLESLKGWVDELVVVDTGSLDDTREIAKKHSADFDNFILKYRAWDDDFSAARNFSMEHATKDWVFIIDADEVVKAGHGENLKRMMVDHKPSAFGVDVLNMYRHPADGDKQVAKSRGKSIRLFRRLGGFFYQNAVHNEIVVPADSNILNVPFDIYHYGYDMSLEKMTKKVDRIVRMCKKRVDENPDDLSALYHYARALKAKPGGGFNEEAADEIIKTLEHAIGLWDGGGGLNRAVHIQNLVLMSRIQYALGNHRETLRYAKKAHALKPDYLDAIWHIALAYTYGISTEKGEAWVHRYLREQEIYNFDDQIDCITTEHANERANAYRVLTDIEIWKQQQYLNQGVQAPV